MVISSEFDYISNMKQFLSDFLKDTLGHKSKNELSWFEIIFGLVFLVFAIIIIIKIK